MGGAPRNSWSLVLYSVLGAAGLLLLLLPLSAGLKHRFLTINQLRPSSVASWMVVGVMPKMYGGRHELWMSTEPLTDFFREHSTSAPFEIVHEWVNHLPARAVRLDGERESAARAGATVHVRLESSYGDEQLVTRYVVRAGPGRIEVRSGP